MRHPTPLLSVALLAPALAGTAGSSAPAPPSPPEAPRAVADFDQMPKPIVLPDGGWMIFLHPVRAPMEKLVSRVSRDGGRSWSPPEVLVELPASSGGWGYPIPLLTRDGEVHVFILQDAGTGILRPLPGGRAPGDRLDIWYTRSSGGRRSWAAPRRIWEGRAGDLQSAIQLGDGRILLPVSAMVAPRSWRNRGQGFDAFTYHGKFECSALYSDDAGATWQHSPSVLKVETPDLGTILGAVEPVVLELRDGRVWMLIRTQRGRFYESFSADRGQTWSAPAPAAIASSDSPAGLVRLRDGRIVMIWNNCLRYPYAYGGRHVLHGAVSRDEGRSWRGFREVVRDPLRGQPPPPNGDFGVSYPFAGVTHDDRVIFSLWVTTAHDRSLVLLDPNWLEETTQRTDFAAGLDDWSSFAVAGAALATHPDRPSARVLRLRREDPARAPGAVWNFPAADRGRLRLRVRLEPGFGGMSVGLTDHFSVPFDDEDRFHNLYTLDVDAAGRLPGGAVLPRGRWLDLDLGWDCERGVGRVTLGGREVAALRQGRASTGASYLRLRSTAPRPDGGVLVESVEATARVVTAPSDR